MPSPDEEVRANLGRCVRQAAVDGVELDLAPCEIIYERCLVEAQAGTLPHVPMWRHHISEKHSLPSLAPMITMTLPIRFAV